VAEAHELDHRRRTMQRWRSRLSIMIRSWGIPSWLEVTRSVRTWRVMWRALVVAGLAIASCLFVARFAARHGFFDLKVYYGAMNYWVNRGGSLYDYLLPHSTYGFTYPPFAALVMLPMAVTPWPVAIVISATACVVATLFLIGWLVGPIAQRYGWTRWYAIAIAVALAASFEPLRETFLFGQVNTLLLFLVGADLVLLVRRGSAWGGVGIGLATAIKLTPGIFIMYLLVTKRWRAAFVASATAAVATLAAAAVAPNASRVFWTDALWNTDRVGSLAFISNQSLNGAIARLHPANPSTTLWVVAVLVVLTIWALRVRWVAQTGDEMTGLALTGIAGCLCSPITWIHHLVWVGPAIILLLDRAMANVGWRRIALLAFMAGSYALLSSRFVWDYNGHFRTPLDWTFSNAYVWVSIALLVGLPIKRPLPRTQSGPQVEIGAQGVAKLVEFDRELAGLIDRERAPAAVEAKTVPLVEPPRGRVVGEHP
jgi:alpha-1,2-mannosyltransferase